MWAFPEREIPEPARAPGAVFELAAERGLETMGEPVALPSRSHRFTHLHASYLPFALEVDGALADENVAWLDHDRPTQLALPVAQQRVLASFGRARAGLGGAD
jgi:hypothetical protein